MLKQLQVSLTSVAMLGLCIGPMSLVAANEPPATATTAPHAPHLSSEEMDKLLAPIALYPDPLIAQILPASTDPGDVTLAARYVAAHKDAKDFEAQSWEESVKALAHYPDVLKMMDEKLDWTTKLGEAFIAQPQDVFNSVQRLRAKAHELGNLKDSPQQKVVTQQEVVQDATQPGVTTEKEIITIIPADPTVVYVPQYAPETVYVQESVDPLVPLVTFGAGLLLGAWIHNEVMWNNGSVYCHNGGWNTNGGNYNGGNNNINIDNSKNFNGGNRPSNGGSTWKPQSRPKASQLPTYNKDGIGNRDGIGDRNGIGDNNGIGDRGGIGGNNGVGDRNGIGSNRPGSGNGLGGNNRPGHGGGLGGNKPAARPSTRPSQSRESQFQREGTKTRSSDLGNRSGGSRPQPSASRGGGGGRTGGAGASRGAGGGRSGGGGRGGGGRGR